MTHKCEYCDKIISPCTLQCSFKKIDNEHLCCTCNSGEACELPEKIVCEAQHCQLKYQIDWYKIKLADSQTDLAKAKALNNQWRLNNIGSENWSKLLQTGDLDISRIKLFVRQQSLTFDQFTIEEAYAFMCFHEEFTKQLSNFLHEKNVKVQIKKELIQDTETKLKKAQKLRDVPAKDITKKNEPRVKLNLTPKEKIVLHHMKTLNMQFTDAVNYVTNNLKMEGEVRKIEI